MATENDATQPQSCHPAPGTCRHRRTRCTGGTPPPRNKALDGHTDSFAEVDAQPRLLQKSHNLM
eukprot:9721692-Alexandrium_andersonii.AAC.1